jgi:hypothetical protein
MPETKRTEAEQVASRVCEMLLKRTAAEARNTVAEFPADGLILEDLIKPAFVAQHTEDTSIIADKTAA